MTLTPDQYNGLSKLQLWYRKYQNQFIELSGVIGTGTWDLVQEFIEQIRMDPREVMYLSYNQKQVLELAYKRYHAYYINSIIYKYIRIVDFDSLPVMNNHSREVKYQWKKQIRTKVDPRYKLIVVFDSMLMNLQTLRDLSILGIPVILIRDPMLLPAPDTYTFLRDANIELNEPHQEYMKNPLIYFAHKILRKESLKPGNYDNVSIVPRKQMNLYNLKSSDMNLTLSEEVQDVINKMYRERILKRKDIINIQNERMIVSSTLYNQKLTNPEEKKVKVFLTKGLVGYISRINKHVPGTKYVPIDFRPEFYHESFQGLSMDRHHLNKISQRSQQLIPDEILKLDYAYALRADLARLSHWDKISIIMDQDDDLNDELTRRMMYSSVTRAKRSLTIIM